MVDRDPKVEAFIRDAFKSAFEFINPNLTNYEVLTKQLSKQIRPNAGGSMQYNFDVELDKLLARKLQEHGITGRIFSEETGWSDTGEPKYRVVYDPFCNSTLASRSFLDSAVGMTFFSFNYKFLASAVMDYQTGLLAVASGGKTRFFQIQSGNALEPVEKPVPGLDKAWAVLTLETPEERKGIRSFDLLMEKAGRIFISSGHIYWLRLALGSIDIYADPVGGEALYEMFACTVAQGRGCIVTDKERKLFDPVEQLRRFEQDRFNLFYPVAARDAKLHAEVLDSLS